MAEDENVELKKTSTNILSRYSAILKELLNYFIITIIAAVVSYIVASSIQSKSFSSEELMSYETSIKDIFERNPIGSDWSMDEMLVNTADPIDQKIVKASIVVSYDDENPAVLEQLSLRKTEIHSAVRNIIGSKKFIEINTTEKQKILAKEIKTNVQHIIGIPGIIEIYIKDFMVH